jgi:hypothetical protein
MPIKAAKALIEVVAGILPGTPMPEFTKRWEYTSEDYEQDRKALPDGPTIFSERLMEAHNYAIGITHPSYVNWVRVDWIWV